MEKENCNSIHIKFKRKLLVNEIMSTMPEYHLGARAWLIRKKHIEDYLDVYIMNHHELTKGCHDVGKTNPMEIDMGVIEFDSVVPQAIEKLSQKQQYNFDDEWQEMLSCIGWEMAVGMREQASGRNPNPTVYKLRQRWSDCISDRLDPPESSE